MGLFDSVLAKCPSCGKSVEFQSKEWNCNMDCYTVENAPGAILRDIVNEPRYCASCGNWMALIDPAFPPGPMPAPTLRPARVKPPEDATIHAHQPSLRWWPDRAFTYADLTDNEPTT